MPFVDQDNSTLICYDSNIVQVYHRNVLFLSKEKLESTAYIRVSDIADRNL